MSSPSRALRPGETSTGSRLSRRLDGLRQTSPWVLLQRYGALLALVCTNALQTAMQGAWMAWREPEGLRAAFASWRDSVWVGVLSACGSAGWFTGFALAPVALVRTLGQVDVLFTLLFSRFYLGETPSRGEIGGALVLVLGVVLVLAGR